MVTETITFTTASAEVSNSSEVERIAAYVALWGRKSAEKPWGCEHPIDEFCEQYGCANFVELAEEIRAKFSPNFTYSTPESEAE